MSSSERMSLLENLPRRVIFSILVIIIIIPLLSPFPVPTPITRHTRNFYDVIESLEPRSVVLLGPEVGVRDLECYPQLVATLKHLKEINTIVIIYTFHPGSALGVEWALDEAKYDSLVYGTDYVHLGFTPGEDAALAAFCEGMVSVKITDHYGNPTATMQIFQQVESIRDVDLAISYGGGTPGPDTWARIVAIPYGTKTLVGATGGVVSLVVDRLAEGREFSGGLLAQRGAVEYETLTGYPGVASATFAPVWLAHVILIVLILMANGALFYRTKFGGGV